MTLFQMSIPPQMRFSQFEGLSPGSVPVRSQGAAQEAEAALSPDEDWEENWGVDSPDSDGGGGRRQRQLVRARDFLFQPPKVTNLTGANYYDFISRLEKCLVIFHNPFQCESVFPRLQFKEVSCQLHHYRIIVAVIIILASLLS